MAIDHAAAEFIDQLLDRDARRGEVHARFLHPARDRERPEPLAAIAAVAREPSGALFQDVAHPVECFHVVFQRRPAEQSDLRDIRRAQPRHAAFTLDRFDHRRFLAADIGTRAAPQFDRRQHVFATKAAGRIDVQRQQFGFENFAALVIFIAQVNIAGVDAGHLRRDQHAFDETMRIALEVITVFEGARFALVDIHRHQSRCHFAPHDAPFAPGRKARAAETTQAGIFHFRERGFDVAFAVEEIEIGVIAAGGLVGDISHLCRRCFPPLPG